MTSRLWLMPPPWNVVKEVLDTLKIPDINIEFKKSDLNLSKEAFQEVELALWPYYRPYYRRNLIHSLTEEYIMSILRQILLPHNRLVSGRDTTIKNKHVKFYKIIYLSESNTLPGEITISFD